MNQSYIVLRSLDGKPKQTLKFPTRKKAEAYLEQVRSGNKGWAYYVRPTRSGASKALKVVRNRATPFSYKYRERNEYYRLFKTTGA